jgi:hypothetical protein
MSDSISNLWGLFGSGGGTSPAVDTTFSGFAPSMSSGQSGTGGFIAPTADDPSTGASQQTSGAGFDWSKLSTALKDLSGGMKSASPGDAVGSAKQQGSVAGSAASAAGRPSAPVSLDNLLTALRNQQQMYMQAAMSGPRRASVVTQKPTTGGLLGY